MRLISYDLNRPRQNYPDLIDAIKDLGPWCRPLASLWLVISNLTVQELLHTLQPHIDANDELLVVDVTGDAAGWTGLSEEASNWLRDNWSRRG